MAKETAPRVVASTLIKPLRISPALRTKLQRVQLLLLDVDGILTDGSIFIGAETEIKRFNIQDGLGLRLLNKVGIKIGWVSARPSFATATRATELKIDYIFQADTGKIAAAEEIIRQCGVQWDNVCFMGDDVVDLGLLSKAGLPITVANAIDEAKAISAYVTKAEGGHGAVREVVHLILKAQNKWEAIVEEQLAR